MAKKAPIYLGRSLPKYDVRPSGRGIGVDDENHMVTIAQSRSGKSTSAIWPNLVRFPYPDSVFVLDPKGEHAIFTSKHRASIGQRVAVLDPFNETKDKVERIGFNPLAHLDPQSLRTVEDIEAIADGCVIPSASSDGTSDHFNKLQRAIIAGVIADVLTTEPKKNQHLPFVYDRLMSLGDDKAFKHFLETMRDNRACGDLPRRGVTMYDMAGDNEKGSIFTTTLSNVKWIASPGMREMLLHDDVRMADLRTSIMTLYLVLDTDAMDAEKQGRFMRVLMCLAFEACRTTPLPADRLAAGRRTLFILDEVAQLGSMSSLSSWYQTLAGSNVKIWSFYQEWEGLDKQMSNSAAVMQNSTKQFFGCNDPDTAKRLRNI